MRRAVTSAMVVLVSACETTPAGAPPVVTECAERDVLAVLSDYSVGSFAGALGPTEVAVAPSVEYGSDPVLRVSGGQAFVLNRYDGLLFALSPRCGTVLGPKRLLSPAQAAWNPQDVACTGSGELWVPFFNKPTLRVLPEGSADGDAAVHDLSLASYDDDGNPNAASVVASNVAGRPKVFVSLGMLDDDDGELPPKGAGKLLRVDVETRQLEDVFTLAGWNPFGHMIEHGGLLYLNDIASHQKPDESNAGIEIFDPQTNRSRLWLDERALGGSVAQLAIDAECGAAIVFGGGQLNPTSLVTFTVPAGPGQLEGGDARVLAAGIVQTAGYDLQGLAWQGRTLYVGDRRAASAGYLVHKFERGAHCTLSPAGDLTVPQMPVALLPTERP